LSALNEAVTRFNIEGRLRVAAFLAQVGHESGQSRYVKELGSDQYLSKYDTGPLAKRLGNTPDADGDGQQYRGGGFIQITGHDNYLACSVMTGNCVRQSYLNSRVGGEVGCVVLEFAQPECAGRLPELQRETRLINGGLNGLAERLVFYNAALKVLAYQERK
jgi:putative chitinase